MLRLEQRQLAREADDDDLLDAVLDQQLDLALERGQEIDRLAEHHARMRVESQHRHRQPRLEGHVEHAPVPAMDSVEGADRHRPCAARQVSRISDDFHCGITVSASHRTVYSGSDANKLAVC